MLVIHCVVAVSEELPIKVSQGTILYEKRDVLEIEVEPRISLVLIGTLILPKSKDLSIVIGLVVSVLVTGA